MQSNADGGGGERTKKLSCANVETRTIVTASQAAVVSKVCCCCVVLEETFQDHSSWVLGHEMVDPDTKEKIYCKQEGKPRTIKCDKPQCRGNHASVFATLSPRAEENERWGGVHTSHTCSLGLIWLHRFLLFKVWSQGQHRHHLGAC